MLAAGGAPLLTAAACTRADAQPPAIKTPYLFGLHVDEARLFDNLHTAEHQAGRRADVVLIFRSVANPPTQTVAKLQAAGYRVALTLQFWDGRSNDWTAWSLASIAAGRHDAALHRWLTMIAQLDQPVHLRPLHEFNGDWYPWGIYRPDNDLAAFHAAWRHIATTARQVAGSKARLQLCINRLNAYLGGREAPGDARTFYPGDDVVDELVINGYNRPTHSRSAPFDQIFHRYYTQLRTLRPDAPLWIGETACTEAFHNKARWIEEMFRHVLTDYPVTCLTWFDETLHIPGEPTRDWRFDTSPTALAAFRHGVRQTAATPPP